VHVCGVYVSLNNVEDGDVACSFARSCGYHAVFGLEESTHYVEYRGTSNGFGLVDLIACEGRVGSHEKVTTRCGDERCDDTDQVVVHVTWISKSLGTGSDDCRDQLICLVKRRCLYVKPVSSDTRQGTVVEDNNRVCVIC